jgi:glyoxylase-like metal-dependent hydrolase (beta-lactamase superfamily II)
MCPLTSSLWLEPGRDGNKRLVCHVLAIETEHSGVVLVDTGIGTEDCLHPRKRLGVHFAHVVIGQRPPIGKTAVRQLQARGLSARDVRHIVLTHCDLDHAGGLPDFPHARVHVMQAEHDAVKAPRGSERSRYRRAHFAHDVRWATYRQSAGENWRGFSFVRELEGVESGIGFLPLAGHTRGHAAVVVEQAGARPLVHCGDAYFHRSSVDPSAPSGSAFLSAFERLMAVDYERVRENHARLRTLSNSGEVDLFCAHDALELERFV